MKVLIVTNMYPNEDNPCMGIFVKEQVESISKQRVDIEVLFINGRKSIFNYIRGIWQVFRKSLVEHYDLVHSHYGLSGIVARCQWKYPLIVSFHGSDINLGWQGFLSKFLARHITKSIVTAKRLKGKLRNKDTQVIPCGVNLDLMVPMPHYYARKKLNLSDDKKYLLFPGAPEKRIKRYDIFEKVLQLLCKRELPVEALVLKAIPHKEVSLYYNAADVMVLTSDSEGSPTVVKEAMACNTPIVSVDVGDIREIIGGTEGCYIAERDPEDIAKKIGLVLRRNRRTNGREKIKHLSLENIADRVISVYKEVARR